VKEELKKELDDLNDKRFSLREFIGSTEYDILPQPERLRLVTQLHAMEIYAYILIERIADL
jgi:hypothetical protein